MSATASPGWDRLLRSVGALCRDQHGVLDGLSDAEWQEFLAECNLHWLTPFVYRKLSVSPVRRSVPRSVWRDLKTMYLLSRARTRRADSLIVPVLAALNAAGIALIVLKGMHLSTQVYADPASRPMIDADLLIRRADIGPAARIIESFGYRQTDAEARSQETRGGPIRTNRHHLGAFWYPDGPPIELHYELEAPDQLPKIDVEGLWKRARPARIGGVDVLVLSPEDALLHLCIHTAWHHLFAVKALSLCDIPVFLERCGDRLDWEVFWSRARAWEVERPVAVMFAFVHDRMGYPLPRPALAPCESQFGRMPLLLRIAERQLRKKASALAKRHLAKLRELESRKPGKSDIAASARPPALRGRGQPAIRQARPLGHGLALSLEAGSGAFWRPFLSPIRLGGLVARYGSDALSLGLWRRLRRSKEPEVLQGIETELDQRILMSWLREYQTAVASAR